MLKIILLTLIDLKKNQQEFLSNFQSSRIPPLGVKKTGLIRWVEFGLFKVSNEVLISTSSISFIQLKTEKVESMHYQQNCV